MNKIPAVMGELDNDVRTAWEQMNALLGYRVIVTPHLELPHTYHPENLEHRYILTPKEVPIYVISLRIGPDAFANPDPTRQEAIESLLEGKIFSPKLPFYWLAQSLITGTEPDVWIDHAYLTPSKPMHKVGEIDGIPVIYYDYYHHAGSMSYGCNHKETLFERMAQVGIVPKEISPS